MAPSFVPGGATWGAVMAVPPPPTTTLGSNANAAGGEQEDDADELDFQFDEDLAPGSPGSAGSASSGTAPEADATGARKDTTASLAFSAEECVQESGGVI